MRILTKGGVDDLEGQLHTDPAMLLITIIGSTRTSTYRNSINQGTKLFPESSIILRNPANTGRPKRATRT